MHFKLYYTNFVRAYANLFRSSTVDQLRHKFCLRPKKVVYKTKAVFVTKLVLIV